MMKNKRTKACYDFISIYVITYGMLLLQAKMQVVIIVYPAQLVLFYGKRSFCRHVDHVLTKR